jgi:hypothetical protein
MMNEPEISSPTEYDLAQQDMDLAVAGLGFGSQDAETAGDASGYTPYSSDQPNLAASGESSLGEYFNEEENRKSA